MPAPATFALERRDGRLVLSWTGGPPAAVYVGDHPDRPGRRLDLQLPDGAVGSIELTDVEPDTRPYLRVLDAAAAETVVAERLVVLEGARNFRDLGGYVTAEGRRVRWGRAFRSDHLGELTAGDLGRLERLGVRTVVDFRNPHEHDETPSAIPVTGPIRRLDRPIGDGPSAGGSFYQQLASGALTSFDAADLTAFYLQTLETSAAVFGEVLGLLADPDHHAVVFHCTAGKDRTGLTAALLLGVLGVDEATILDDYELTNTYRSGRRVEELRPALAENGIDIDRYLPLFTAPRAAMAAALAALAEGYGSVEGFLTARAGLAGPDLAALRAHLLA